MKQALTILILSILVACRKSDNLIPCNTSVLSLDSLKILTSTIPNGIYTDLTFIDETTGFAITEGFIAKTTDGGSTWTSISLPINTRLKKIQFTDSQTGYIIGGDNTFGVLLKTTDSGQNWTAYNLNTLSSPYSMYFLDNHTGFITGKDLFSRTTDGGQSWTSLKSPAFRMYQDINFRNHLEGYITSNGGVYFKTTDGGISWNRLQKNDANYLYEIYFANDKTFIVQSPDSLIKIENNFTYIKKPYNSKRLFFINAQKSIGIGHHYYQGFYPYGDILITNDGWKTFHTKTFSPLEAMRFTAIAKVNDNKIMMLGAGLSGTRVVVLKI